MNHPDPKLHKQISFVKSAVRIIAATAAMWTGSVVILAGGLLLAELIGVYEEMV